ncbi:MAG TPA: DnaJ C-terminal domain-containing protein [Acidimicrobiales bacterium]|nr:DnaJ C-terminal domain-containing protein [Acidimicrobiales bacterium]
MAVHGGVLGKDHYEVLGVAEEASHEDIQRAYRRLARRHHPDANPGDAGAEERFKESSAAYEVLGDPVKRREYDQVRRSGYAAGGFDPGAGTFRVTVDDLGDLGGLGDLGDLLGNLFGGRRPASARPGHDLEAPLDLSFEDAVSGVTTEVQARDTAGSSRSVRVRVPAGVEDGQRIRVTGLGGPGLDGGPPGDLYVTVRVAPHAVFGRSGRDLTLTLPVTYPEAALGAEVKVPTLDGEPVTVRIPPGTPTGRTLRVRGRGVPHPGGHRGDLLVSIEVAVPQRLTSQQRAAVEALAQAMDGSPRTHLEA